MPNNVADFLIELGFTHEDILEFYEIGHNFNSIGEGERKISLPDCISTVVLEEEQNVDLRDEDEVVEAFWEKGWVTDFCFFRRSNFDSYEGRYYKAFPTRYKLWEFKFTKSLRRVLNKNRDLKTVIRPLRITPAKSTLHDLYNLIRHAEPPRKPLAESYKYIRHYPTELLELCIFKDDKLIACSIFEVGNFSMYSNTSFWDMNEKPRGLGTLTILLEIKYALERNLHYYYLGHFYPQNPVYHYKTRFSGLQLFDWENESWVDFKIRRRIIEMLKQKLPRRD